MSQLTKYSLKDTSNAEDNESWFWDILGDLHDKAKDVIAEHMARLARTQSVGPG